MKTTITFNGKTFIEEDNTNVQMTEFECKCGNLMDIPLAAVVLGLTETCGHCTATHGYPKKQHCASLTEGYKCLIEDEEYVEF